jgi:glutamate carboxypeptidase
MEVLELLRELVEIESPTGSPGVRIVAERIARELESLGGNVEFLPGDHLRAELSGNGAPLLLLGHSDTVWPAGTLERMPFRVENGNAFGPGTYDMKAGLVIMLAAIARADPMQRRALRVFVTADEERGSLTAHEQLADTTTGVAAALVLEPAGAGGSVKTSRKGLGRFLLTITGRASHAGTEPASGASAIDELARQILALHALADPTRGITVNVGVVEGGTAENVVAASAEAIFDVRVATLADRDQLDDALRSLSSQTPGTAMTLGGGWTRPPLERSPGAVAMFERAREHGRALGLDLDETSSAGGSDGNLVGALGVPVLDGLGAVGAGAHADHEHVLIESLPIRTELVARLLIDPGI